VLFPSPRVSSFSFSSSRALNAKQYRIRIVVPVAFTFAKIVASTKVKGKKKNFEKTARRRFEIVRKKATRGPPFYITKSGWRFKIFLENPTYSLLSKETFERKREKRGRSHRPQTRMMRSALKHTEREREKREREREREPLRHRRFNFVDRFVPHAREEPLSKKKNRTKNAPSSFVVMVPSPSLSNKANASLNSVICSSVSSAAIVVISLRVFFITRKSEARAGLDQLFFRF